MSGGRSLPGAPRTTRQFLIHLDTDLIRRVKILAIERNLTASKVVHEALVTFLSEPIATRVADDSGNAP